MMNNFLDPDANEMLHEILELQSDFTNLCKSKTMIDDGDKDSEQSEAEDLDASRESAMRFDDSLIYPPLICPFHHHKNENDLKFRFKSWESLSTHLLHDHQIQIENIQALALILHEYLAYWKSRIDSGQKTEFEKIGIYDSSKNQFMLGGDADEKIRQELWAEKRGYIIAVNERERREWATTDLHLPCLFCRHRFDNMQILFKHMHDEHSLNIGLLDNLVFVREFLGDLRQKLDSLKCIYCELTFKSAIVLRKHMRKKKHFKVNPQNRAYDRFYMVNYLEYGKSWRDFSLEDDEYSSKNPSILSEPSVGFEEAEERWSDWTSTENQPTMCLFCDYICSQPEQIVQEHLVERHQFRLDALPLNFYDRVKLVNYIRKCTFELRCFVCGSFHDSLKKLSDHLDESGHSKIIPEKTNVNMFWHDPQFLIPFYEDDPLLQVLDSETELEN